MASNSQAVVAVGQVQSSVPAPQLDVVDTQTREIGLIIPPPDIRAIVDKTADFVAKNGTAFEEKILSQPKNVKFNFLHANDPYNKYYKYKIMEAQEGPEKAKEAFKANSAATPGAVPAPVATPAVPDNVPPPTQELVKPDDEVYTVHIPSGLTLQELDIIKLTALYVARNGKEFLTGLRSRESNSRDFQFLKENHSLFTLFRQLSDAYSAVLLPTKDTKANLQTDSTDADVILARCLRRLEWNRVKESEADEVAAERERERMAMMMIDWHDFSIVRTIEFDDAEDASTLPRPLTLANVIQMNKAAPGDEDGEGAEMEDDTADGAEKAAAEKDARAVQAMDEEEASLVAAGQQAPPSAPPAAAAPPQPEGGTGQVRVDVDDDAAPIKVIKDYKRTAAGQAYDPNKYVISPITGELVPLEEMQEHMRINLIDPKWKEQREAMLAKIKDTSKANDVEIMSNLTRLAGTRPDIFGSSAEELGRAMADGVGELQRDGPQAGPAATGAKPATGGAAAGQKPVLAPLPAAPASVAMPPPPSTGAMPPPPLPPPARPPGAPPAPDAALPPPPRPPANQEQPDPKRQKT